MGRSTCVGGTAEDMDVRYALHHMSNDVSVSGAGSSHERSASRNTPLHRHSTIQSILS